MKANKAFVFRLKPTREQKILIGKTFGCVRFVYNKMLEEKIAYYNEHGKSVIVTPAKYKPEFPFLKEVDSLALANAQMNLEVAYRNFFRDKSIGFPRFKSKKDDRNSYTTNCVNNNIRIEGKYLLIPKLGKVRIVQHRYIPDGYKLKSATISQSSDGKYFVSVLFEYMLTIQPNLIDSIIGLDFSMTELYISSEGEKPNFPRYYRRALSKLARMQRVLSKMEKHSNNYYRQRRKIAKFHAHIANQRKDFLHKQSRQIANAYDCVAIESLNMKAMSQTMNFGKSVADNGWGMFTSYLAYKLKEQGKYLIKVDKWFPSSKTCCVCGNVKKELTIEERTYFCECGNVMDRDINAAVNIRNEAIRMLAIV